MRGDGELDSVGSWAWYIGSYCTYSMMISLYCLQAVGTLLWYVVLHM